MMVSEQVEVDDLDHKIMRILKKDSRRSYRNIAQELGIATATVISRINNLEEQGVIKGYGVRIDYEKLGYDIIALVELAISKGKLLEVEEKVSQIPNVFGVYDLTGTYDAVILARFKTRRELNSMIKSLLKLDDVERTNTHLILNVIREGGELA